jgi:hypothetical protein
MLRKKRIWLGKLSKMLMVEGQLEELSPDSLSRLLRECFELAEESLVLLESCSVVRDVPICHLNIIRSSKLSMRVIN